MATVKEITSMCREGRIQEAYDIAISDLEAEPTNAWAQREVAWAIYYKMKAYAENGNYDQLMEHLDKLQSLNLLTVEDDNIIFENIVRAYGGYFRSSFFLNDHNPLQKLSTVIQKLQEYGYDEQKIQQQAGWALYFLIKDDAENGKYDSLVEHLGKLTSLDMLSMEDDGMIFENVLFAISKYIKNHVFLNDPSTSSKLWSIFQLLNNYNFNPSRGYSYLLQNHLKFVDFWDGIADFLNWWNLDNLTQEDYTPFVNQRGQKMMTLAERAFIANSKALLKFCSYTALLTVRWLRLLFHYGIRISHSFVNTFHFCLCLCGHMVTAVTVTAFVCGLVFSTVFKGTPSNTVMDAF